MFLSPNKNLSGVFKSKCQNKAVIIFHNKNKSYLFPCLTDKIVRY